MFFIQADLIDRENDYNDTIVIGLFSSTDKAIYAADKFVKEEKSENEEIDIRLYGWKTEIDDDKIERIDLSNDIDCVNLIKYFREIENKY